MYLVISAVILLIFDQVKSLASLSLDELLLLTVAAGLVALVVIYGIKKRGRSQPPETQGFRFYHSRSDLSDLKTELDSARQEIIIVGGTLEIAKATLGTLDDILARDEPKVKLKLLLMDEESPYIKGLEEAHTQEGIKASIHATLQALCSTRSGMDDLKRERIEIRTFKILPLCSMVIIDREKIRVEPYIYRIKGADKRPSFEYSKSTFRTEFERYWKGYEHILSNSEEFRCDRLNRPPSTVL